MRITTTQPLFAWESLGDSPSLHTIRELPASIPDAKLLHSLHQARGKGRDDYPVPVLSSTLGKMKLSAVAKTLRAKVTAATESERRTQPA